MTDDVWRRDEIDSPCVKICVIHPGAGLCVGCLRSGEEIARWSRMSPERRLEIMNGLPDRAPRLAEAGVRPSARRRPRERR